VVRSLRIGIQLPEVERDVRWQEEARMARAAELAGFDSIWVGDHYLYRDDGRPERGPWEAWTLLGALAAVTERVALGPLVACLGFHPPVVLAKMAATVDQVSGGRLVLGVGAGWNEPEFRAIGLPFDRRASRFEESFDIVRRLLVGDRVTTDGRFWKVEDAVLLPTLARRLPLMVGSVGDRILAATLPHVDVWNTWFEDYGNTPEGFAALNDRITGIVQGCGRESEAVKRSACALVVLDQAAHERLPRDDVPPLEGPPERVASALRDLADAGADEVILVVDPITEGSIGALEQVLTVLDA
jgi:probable F420-dependent oxidoreductase